MPLFGWTKPDCPVGIREKTWVELRMRWLGEQFGTSRLTRCEMILPTGEHFPDVWDGTPESARRLFDRLCQYMEVPSSHVTLQIFSENSSVETVDSDEPDVIRISDGWLSDPNVLVATLAWKLAHYALNRRNLLANDPDRWLAVELTPVVFGLGIFTANATIIASTAHGSHRSVDRMSYLPARVTAYAMALHAWLRGDDRPAWTGHLRRDAAEAFDQGLQFLSRTEDSLLCPFNIRSQDQNPSIGKLLDQLERGSNSARVAALWELARCDSVSAESVRAVTDCLADRQTAIRAEAVRTLAEWESASEPSIAELIEALDDREGEVRMAATYALGKLRLRPETVLPELADRLCKPETIDTVAWALAQFGPVAKPTLPLLLSNLKDELARGDGAIDYLAYAVRAISPDPDAELQSMIDSCDAELQPQARELLPEHGTIKHPPGSNGLSFWTGI